jgi:mannose-6-phosphate isomerase-like protein (cupin superfamily)
MKSWHNGLFFGIKDMFIKDLSACEPFLAGDATHLRELLHPDKADLKINYSLAHAVVKPGQTSLSHRLRTSEVYYILEGKGIMCINDEHALVKPGQAIYIPPRSRQSIHNPGDSDLVFLCIVDPAWRQEDEEVM